MSAAHHILGMINDTRQQIESDRIGRAFSAQLAQIDRLTKRCKTLKQDKRTLLEEHLQAATTMGGLMAEIKALRECLRRLNPDHPALQENLMEPVRAEGCQLLVAV
jgi:predicted  nucleic acid-binding Zn-ribbon protein